MSSMTIHTYGGSEVLLKIFQGISMLFYGDDGIVRPLAIIIASVGGLWALSKAFFSSPESFLTTYLFPLMIIPGIFLFPTSQVRIEDVLLNKSDTVEHVPLFLAKFSELVSSIGYQITTSIEGVMHTPNDPKYLTTGMIFGAETSLDISHYKVINADLEQNLRKFSKQCVLYDLGYGRYSMDEFKKTTDLWDFLEKNTSTLRMIDYIDPVTKKSSYQNCQNALKLMKPIFEKERKYQAQSDIIKNLPLILQVLTKQQQKNVDEISGQMIMMNLLAGDFSGGHFAKSRAQSHQQNTYVTLGAIASNGMVILRIVIEALIYVSFIFIVPLSFFPGCFRLLFSWAWLTIWIQLWPPLYAVLNYAMQIAAGAKASWIFSETSEKGLSFFTNVGLENLYDQISALNGALTLSIPIIAQYILQGGVQTITHLTSSLMAPAQSAAATAASEQTTGNYSFANSSVGHLSYDNASSFQKNFAPSLSSGFMTENKGSHSNVYASDQMTLNQTTSNLRTSFSSDENIVENLQKAHQYSKSSVDSNHQNFMESASVHVRNTSDLTEHLGKSENYNDGQSMRQGHDVHESARYVINEAENFGKTYNLSTRESLDILAATGSGGPISWIAEAKISHHDSYNKDEILNAAKSISASADFQRNLQEVKDFSSSQSYSSLSDEGIRIAESYAQSLDDVKSSQNQYQASMSKMNQISENLSWAETHSQSIKESLNQEFVDWASDKYSCQGGYSHLVEVLNSKNFENERADLFSEFVQSIRKNSDFSLDNFQNPDKHYANLNIKQINKEGEFARIKSETYEESLKHDLEAGHVKNQASSIFIESDRQSNQVENNLQSANEKVSQKWNPAHQEFSESYHESKIPKMYKKTMERINRFGKTDDSVGSGNFQMSEKPFWIKEEG